MRAATIVYTLLVGIACSACSYGRRREKEQTQIYISPCYLCSINARTMLCRKESTAVPEEKKKKEQKRKILPSPLQEQQQQQPQQQCTVTQREKAHGLARTQQRCCIHSDVGVAIGSNTAVQPEIFSSFSSSPDRRTHSKLHVGPYPYSKKKTEALPCTRAKDEDVRFSRFNASTRQPPTPLPGFLHQYVLSRLRMLHHYQ